MTPTLVNVWTHCLFADRVQVIFFNNTFNFFELRRKGMSEPKPIRFPFGQYVFIVIRFNTISYGYSAIIFYSLNRNNLTHLLIIPSNLSLAVFSKSLNALSIETSANLFR